MKRVKKGFTLAEVLITLAIIGVVAALTIPTLMADSRYQLISSRIAKFRSTTEDAGLAYAAMYDTISKEKLSDIILYKSKTEKDGKEMYELKDDTSLEVTAVGEKNGIKKSNDKGENGFGTESEILTKYGAPVVLLKFKPNVSGMTTVKQEYTFVMTDKGYVMPDKTDHCLELLFSKDKKGKMDKSMTATSSEACNAKYNEV